MHSISLFSYSYMKQNMYYRRVLLCMSRCILLDNRTCKATTADATNVKNTEMKGLLQAPISANITILSCKKKKKHLT